MDTSEAWLRLALCPGLSHTAGRELVAWAGSAADATSASAGALREAGLPPEAVEFLGNTGHARLDCAQAWLEMPGHHLLTPDDPLFPPLLLESGSAPLCLFVAGDPAVLSLPQLAIVGSRNATPGGCQSARGFAAFLADAGLVITSGLAEGIDAAAHRGALQKNGQTIAIMGTGPDEIYPRGHTELAMEIAAQGALVTEFAPGTPATRDHFPRRNRIISALSLGVLVVEAGQRSGALITARHAGDFGREIFAVPGSIHSPLSKGCHRLIRQGAHLVESAQDIIDELAALAGAMEQLELREHTNHAATQPPAQDQPDPQYINLLDAMAHDPVSINELVNTTGLTAEELSSMLLILELEGRVNSVTRTGASS